MFSDDFANIGKIFAKFCRTPVNGIYSKKKKKFLYNNFFSKCDQIPSILAIWSYLLKKSLLENFIFVFCVLNFH